MDKINKLKKRLDTEFIIAKLMNRLPNMLHGVGRSFNDKRHNYIMNLLNPYFHEAHLEIKKEFHSLSGQASDKVWVFWWQGIDSMPDIVKKCYESLVKFEKEKVVLITKENFKEYTNIPNYILKKVETGEMTLTHFSDILRFNLLRNHGGLWVDSTVLFINELTNMDVPFYTCSGYYDDTHFFVSRGRWTGFLIGGSKNLELFIFMDEFFRIYWKENSVLIDYFLIDYALNYAYSHNISNFKNYSIENNGINNPHLFDLMKEINGKFDNNKYMKWKRNDYAFKLSYKKKIIRKESYFFYEIVKLLNLD